MMAKYVTKSSCYFNGQTNATKRARSCMGLEGAMKSAYSVQRNERLLGSHYINIAVLVSRHGRSGYMF